MYIVGIDEVGRGPLAGPVSVGIVWIKQEFDFGGILPGLTDSKKLSEKKREELYKIAVRIPEISFKVLSNSAKVIDTKGIEWAIQDLIAKGCEHIPKDSFVYLDGRLKAPERFEQETVVRGDVKIPVISLASVVAKVERDRYMKNISPEYPEYGFYKHKGYGTQMHREAIAEHGLSEVHRESFCSKI